MGTTVSGPSITVDETAETITLTACATNPASFLRVFGCETMTVTAEAEAIRKIKALDVVLAIGMSGSMRRGDAPRWPPGGREGLTTRPALPLRRVDAPTSPAPPSCRGNGKSDRMGVKFI